MQIKNNFITVVALGCFNPAILTPQFLKEKCGFESDLEPKGRTIPISAVISYGDISFLLDLERFVIKHSKVDDFLNSNIIPVMIKYLSVLQYTPVQAVGVNLNYNVTGVNVSDVQKTLQEDTNKLFEVLRLSEAITTYKYVHNKEGNRHLIEFDIAGQIDRDIVERLNIIFKDELLQVNYNHEIQNIEQNRELIKRIEQDWHLTVENEKAITEKFFEELK